MDDHTQDPVSDPGRLQALAETGLVGAPAEDAFDRFTRLARQLLDAPTSLFTLVDPNQQFFLSADGFGLEPWSSCRGTPLSHSFCRKVVADGEFIVGDARSDPRTIGHPAVTELGVVAYAGVPVRGPEGEALGALCAIDDQPRSWTEDDIKNLRDLAAAAGSEIALRVTADRRRRHAAATSRQVRSPLTALRIQLADIAERLDGDPELRRDLASSTEQLDMLSDSVVELIEAAEASRFGFEEKVDVNQILRGVATDWAPADGDPLVRAVDTSDVIDVIVPAGALRQVIDELVGIVIDYARGPVVLSSLVEGATVRIDVRHEAGPLPGSFRAELLGDPVEVVSRRVGGRLAPTPDGFQLILPGIPTP